MAKESTRNGWRIACALIMSTMGVLHLIDPGWFAKAVPDYLPNHLPIAIISGLAEIAGGVGLLVPLFRKSAAMGLIILYVAIFPANIHMALHPQQWVQPQWTFILWLRLPFQLLFIWIAWWVGGLAPLASPQK
ncbi:MAG TPA: hypothetical protein VG944_06800 [Fimbriimonas sp.]|nr:hypothetical protein [Fimbriimonas sp.]